MGQCLGHYNPWAHSGEDLAVSGLVCLYVWAFWTCFPRHSNKELPVPWLSIAGACQGFLSWGLIPGIWYRGNAASGPGASDSWQENWLDTCLVGQSPSLSLLLVLASGLTFLLLFRALSDNEHPVTQLQGKYDLYPSRDRLSLPRTSFSYSYRSHTLGLELGAEENINFSGTTKRENLESEDSQLPSS